MVQEMSEGHTMNKKVKQELLEQLAGKLSTVTTALEESSEKRKSVMEVFKDSHRHSGGENLEEKTTGKPAQPSFSRQSKSFKKVRAINIMSI